MRTADEKCPNCKEYVSFACGGKNVTQCPKCKRDLEINLDIGPCKIDGPRDQHLYWKVL